jgi:hypothetical protein
MRDGKRLFEKEMATGERYEVPIEVAHPIARIGRPDKIQVTINGSNVPPLGPGDQAVSVDVSAAALRARGTPGATPSPAPSPMRAACAHRSAPPGAARSGQRRLFGARDAVRAVRQFERGALSLAPIAGYIAVRSCTG